MQRLEVSGAVRPIYGSLGVKWLISFTMSSLFFPSPVNILSRYLEFWYLLQGVVVLKYTIEAKIKIWAKSVTSFT